MGPIWTVIARCSQGHVVAAMAIDSREVSIDDGPEILRAEMRRRILCEGLSPACAICASGTWHYIALSTKLQTLAEGGEEVDRLEARQVEARELTRAFMAKQSKRKIETIPPVVDDR